MPYFLPVTGQTTFLGEDMWRGRGPGVRLTMDISQEYLSHSLNKSVKGSKMRITFTMEVKTEIESFDIKKRQVITRLMNEAARRLHTQITMLSDNVSPKIKVTATNPNGVQEGVQLFDEAK